MTRNDDYIYDFRQVKGTLTKSNVVSIIEKAGYDSADYEIESHSDKKGFKVSGEVFMSITKLEQAAKDLKIPVEISSPNNLAADEYKFT
ncbi:MAG: hypothetical protein AAGD01_17440 [Acidobacteriota bacterium]